MGLLFVVFTLLLAIGRVQVRDKGIRAHPNFYRWRRFDAYCWDPAGRLSLRWGGTDSWTDTGLQVSNDQRQAVEELLSKNGLSPVVD